MLYEENPKMAEVMLERDEYRYLYEKEERKNKTLLNLIKEKNEKIKELENFFKALCN